MALGVPDSLKIGPQPSTAMISKIPKPSNSLTPYGQYFTLLVNMLVISLLSTSVSGTLSITFNKGPSPGLKDFQAIGAAVGAWALSYFIVIGLSGIDQKSKEIGVEMPSKLFEEKLRLAIEKYGSHKISYYMALTGKALSILAMLANLASLSTNLYDNHTGSEVKITAEAQVVTIKTFTDFANLLGFIFFNVLGMRNAKIQDSLNIKLPSAENIEEIDQLGRQRNELSGVGPVAAGVGISSVPSAGSQVFAGASGQLPQVQ